MIPEEIVGRRFPRSYGYRIPHSEFIEQADPSLLDVSDYSSREIGMNHSENVAINNTNPDEAQPARSGAGRRLRPRARPHTEELTAAVAASASASKRAAVAGGSGGSP